MDKQGIGQQACANVVKHRKTTKMEIVRFGSDSSDIIYVAMTVRNWTHIQGTYRHLKELPVQTSSPHPEACSVTSWKAIQSDWSIVKLYGREVKH